MPEIPLCPGASQIQITIDEFVTNELRDFERHQESVGRLKADPSAVVTNMSSIRFVETMRSDFVISYVVECHYNYPGAATSYQRTVGLTFRTATGDRLNLPDVLIDDPENLPSLRQAFIDAVLEVHDSAIVDQLPTAATFALGEQGLGIATNRYDIQPGYLGAPVIWISYPAVGRLLRPDFQRLLSRLTKSA